MHSHVRLGVKTARNLLMLLLIVILVACGSTRNLNQAQTSPSSELKGLDLTKLLHVELSDYSCASQPYNVEITYKALAQGNLILATSRLTYDISELNQMASYVQMLTNGSASTLPPAPSTLRWIPGVAVGSSFDHCRDSLVITNIGNIALQLKSIHMRLSVSPVSNNVQYHLIDACSLLSASEGCEPLFGGCCPDSPNIFDLSDASVNTIFLPESLSTGGQSSLESLLKPNDVINIQLVFAPKGSSNNFIYTLTPELIFDRGIVELQHLAIKVAFADQSHFSCYSLYRDTFMIIPHLIGFDPGDPKYWCI